MQLLASQSILPYLWCSLLAAALSTSLSPLILSIMQPLLGLHDWPSACEASKLFHCLFLEFLIRGSVATGFLPHHFCLMLLSAAARSYALVMGRHPSSLTTKFENPIQLLRSSSPILSAPLTAEEYVRYSLFHVSVPSPLCALAFFFVKLPKRTKSQQPALESPTF